ncbi:hypothetical protein CRYUN_Cryun37aG0073300 [Craigia yunnanensis]
MAKASSDFDFAEELYLSEILEGNEGDLLQLDAKFAEQLHFQEAIFFSVKEMSSSTSKPMNIRANSSMPKHEPRESATKSGQSSLSYCGRLYCPFKNCSALLLNDSQGEVITETECPACNRLFCAQCHVSWHPGINCEEYQKLNEDERGREDLMRRNLAKENKWRRCSSCHIIVERTEGCLHMTCRLVYELCLLA